MTIRLTREELYEAVWQQPMYKVADTLGIPRARVRKLCRDQYIPTPERGHWRKVRVGMSTFTPELPPLGGNAPASIAIHDHRAVDPEIIANLKYGQPEYRNNSAEPLSRISARELEAPGDLGATHQLVQTTEPNQISCVVSEGCFNRARRLLSELVEMGWSQGLQLQPSSRGACFFMDGVQVSVALSELFTTDKPSNSHSFQKGVCLTDLYARELDVFRNQPTGSDRFLPTGQLQFEIDGGKGTDHLQRTFAESSSEPMEELIPTVLSAVIACALAARARKPRRSPARRKTGRKPNRSNAKLLQQASQPTDTGELDQANRDWAEVCRIEAVIQSLRESFAGGALSDEAKQFIDVATRRSEMLIAKYPLEVFGEAILNATPTNKHSQMQSRRRPDHRRRSE